MRIEQFLGTPNDWGQDPVTLWEDNMHEPWSDYAAADKFVVLDGSEIVGGFAVYWDESDGVAGNFCSGWAAHRKKVPTADILKQLARTAGDIYFKTDKRPAKFLLEKIGQRVKNTDRFVYYVIRGNTDGKAKKSSGCASRNEI